MIAEGRESRMFCPRVRNSALWPQFLFRWLDVLCAVYDNEHILFRDLKDNG